MEMTLIKDLDRHLRRSIKKHGIPGASIGVLRGKRVIAASAAGVLNLNTKIPATTDSVFQIGSITKPFTATMIMQLRDEGRLSLDDRLLDYLPNFRSSNMQRLNSVTLRHLLCHQSGIDGDFFPPMKSGDQTIGELLKMASMLPSLFEPGTNWSYCNIGFSCLGRIIEILDNRSFDESLQQRIFDPLEMKLAMSRPEDNMRFRVAVGHVPKPGKSGQLMVPDYPYLSIGHRAAGSTPAMTATELLKFAAAHLQSGTGLNGAKLLSKRTAAEMLRPQLRPLGRANFGLAWLVAKWSGERIFTHNGGTVGQYSQLVICPRKRIAVAALTNGGNAEGLFRDIVGGILESSARIKMPPMPTPRDSARPIPDQIVGHYENMNFSVEISEEAGALMVSTSLPDFGGADARINLKFAEPRLAVTPMGLLEFGGSRGQVAQWIRVGSRLLVRKD